MDLMNRGLLSGLLGIGVGLHFGRRFGLLGKTLSAYAGIVAAGFLVQRVGSGATLANGRTSTQEGSESE